VQRLVFCSLFSPGGLPHIPVLAHSGQLWPEFLQAIWMWQAVSVRQWKYITTTILQAFWHHTSIYLFQMLIISRLLQWCLWVCNHRTCNKSQYMYGVNHKNAWLGEVFVKYIIIFMHLPHKFKAFTWLLKESYSNKLPQMWFCIFWTYIQWYS
jgi:hypothetical protein